MAKRAASLGDPGGGLAAVSALRREVETLEVEQVRLALDKGWSWRQIAEALGVSKQAAHRKHAARPPRAIEPAGERQRLVITGQARRAVEYARDEARQLNHSTVEPAHLLLGLLRSGDGAVGSALREAGIDLDSTRRDARAARPASAADAGPGAARTRLPISPRARQAFEQALREAVARGDDHLGMEHVLLALVRNSEGGAVETLGRLGVAPRRLQRLLERAIVKASERSPGASGQPG